MHRAELWFGGQLWERFPYGAIFDRLGVSKTFEPRRFHPSNRVSTSCSDLRFYLCPCYHVCPCTSDWDKRASKLRVSNPIDCRLNSTYCSHKSFIHWWWGTYGLEATWRNLHGAASLYQPCGFSSNKRMCLFLCLPHRFISQPACNFL